MHDDRLKSMAASIWETPRASRPVPGRAGTSTVIAVGALGVVLVAASMLVALRGGMPEPGWLAVRNALMIGAPIAVGLYALRDATHARFGRLLVVAGLFWSLVGLTATMESLPYSIGRMAAWAAEVGIVYLILAFPSGRLPGRPDRLLMAAVTLLIGVLYIPTGFLVDHFPVPTYYVTCSADCPANAFTLLSATPAWITDGVLPVREAITVVITALIAWRLVYRMQHATRLMRRALWPVLVCAIVRITSLGAWIILRRAGVIDDGSAIWLADTLALSLPLMSAGFLAGLLSWRLYASDALLLLAQRLRAAHTTEERRTAIAQVVMDPSLEFVFARPRGGDGWVTADGWPAHPPDDERAVTVISSDAGPVAALIHDPALVEQRAFLEAVGGFALVWDENQRLAERVDTSNDELQESRARILAAADNERRRIERDLHDGGQQRLVALRIRLQLAEEMMVTSPAGAREMLQRLARDVDGVLEELRSLAAGVYPAALAAHGLLDAVRAVATESPLPVHVKVNGSERYPDDVEAAVYFCCLEAMQNVAKHAPGSTRIWVVLELGGDLQFEVRDDGLGFDVETTQRRGLDNMRDRVAALGGRFEVMSAPGTGTRIRGRLPGAPRVRTPQSPQGGRSELLLADERRGA
jgi:signal transduction histidine kinase